jgi:hypothetical protein
MESSTGIAEEKPPAEEPSVAATSAAEEEQKDSKLPAEGLNDQKEEDTALSDGSNDNDSDNGNDKEKEAREAARYAALRNHRIRFEDAIDPNAERVKKLNKYDIVFGRGRGFQNHPGNLRMREIIDKYKTEYHSLKRQEKREMVAAVYKEIIGDGARFLKKLEDEDTWVKVDIQVALQKVSHTLRCRKNVEKQLAESETMAPGGLSPTLSHAGLAGAPRSHAALTGMFGNPAMNMGFMRPSDPSTSLEAQRIAALQRYRVLSGIPTRLPAESMAMPPSVEYYNMVRRQQLIRETMMLQQMGDACLFEGGQPRRPGNMAASMATGGLNTSVNSPRVLQGEKPRQEEK